jgi:hypothetical protein
MRSDKFRRESAIETISKGKRTLSLLASRTDVPSRIAHDLLILFRLKAAGAVNKLPFGFRAE